MIQYTKLHSINFARRTSIGNFLGSLLGRKKRLAAGAVEDRFYNRYLASLGASVYSSHPFSQIAIFCLMIVELEAFRQGWPDTSVLREKPFATFFARYRSFAEFRAFSSDFYHLIRCGIFHRGEPMGGWSFDTFGSLIDFDSKIINIKEFSRCMHRCFYRYIDDLKSSDWDSEIWINLRYKVDSIVDNYCDPRDSKALYFAYGSDMYTLQLRKRIENFTIHGYGALTDVSLEFKNYNGSRSGRANIAGGGRRKVLGILYEVEKSALEFLDEVEDGYKRIYVPVISESGARILAHTYISDSAGENQPPTPEHLHDLQDGAIEHSLPDWYLSNLKRIETLY